jgi:CheY-like chemotaxis protein
MDEATQAKAAEPFFTTKGVGKGTGLGLSMVHGLTVQSGGVMKLSSQLGSGTTVQLWFPRAPSSERIATEPVPIPLLALEAPEPTLAKHYAVLVVDDDGLVGAGTAAMVEDLGHQVTTALSAARALEVLQTSPQKIDIVITDYAMPGMTGLELAEEIKRSFPGTAVILATGYAELPNGAQIFSDTPRLSKPFRQSELAAALETIIPSSATIVSCSGAPDEFSASVGE